MQNLNFAREVVIRSHLAGQLGLALIFWVAFIGFGHWSTWVVLAVFCGAASEPISMVVGRYRSKAPEQEAMHGTARVARVSDLESNDFVRRRDRRR